MGQEIENIINDGEVDWKEARRAYYYWAEKNGLNYKDDDVRKTFDKECENNKKFFFNCVKEWRRHCYSK